MEPTGARQAEPRLGLHSIRTENDEAITRLFAKTEEAGRKVVNRVAVVAKARGISRAQVTLAWLLAKPVITAPIVGATKLHHLDDALAAVKVKLAADEISVPVMHACLRPRYACRLARRRDDAARASPRDLVRDADGGAPTSGGNGGRRPGDDR